MSAKALILVQLLEKIPDADKLRRLLEPENLLYLLQQYGFQKEELQHRLKNGTLPGELLLELLERESDVEYLLGMLSDTMDTKVEKRVVLDDIIKQQRENARTTPLVTPVVSVPPVNPSSETASAAPVTSQETVPSTLPENRPSPRRKHQLYVPPPDEKERVRERAVETISMFIIGLTSILPAGTWKSFSLNIVLCVIIASIGGAAAGALYARYKGLPRSRTILIGIVLDVGILLTLMAYLEARPSISKLELLIPVGIGILPALGLYYLLNQKK